MSDLNSEVIKSFSNQTERDYLQPRDRVHGELVNPIYIDISDSSILTESKFLL